MRLALAYDIPPTWEARHPIPNRRPASPFLTGLLRLRPVWGCGARRRLRMYQRRRDTIFP